MATKEIKTQIRKLRKKLRQIENLESSDRDLTTDEVQKIQRKVPLRADLLDLLSRLPEDYELSYSDYSPTKQPGDENESRDMTEYASNESYTDIPHLSEEEEEVDYDYEEDEPEISEDLSEEDDMINAAIEEKVRQPVAPVKIKLEEKKTAVKRSSDDKLQPAKTEVGRSGKASNKKAKTTDKESDGNKPSGLTQKWRNMAFETTLLNGHNDLVCAVVTDGTTAITGSRDTMVKVWSLSNRSEVRSLGGHTGTVTSVLLLTQHQAASTCKYHDVTESDLCVSGSSDCSIKIWHLQTGQMVKSIYTYNPVTCLQYLDGQGLIIAGSGGGKIELWSPEGGECVHSAMAHDDEVSGIQVEGDLLYSSSVDGVIKVFQLRDLSLHPVFVSEDVKLEGSPRGSVIWRHIRSMAVNNQNIYFGDEGMNVKVLNWKKGSVHKLCNHQTEFGVTDALNVHDNLLLCSGYDLDNGVGYVNVRSVNDEKYIATISNEDTPRVMCMACGHTKNNKLQILTGGFELKLWQQIEFPGNHGDNDNVIRTRYISRYGARVRHSDIDSDTDLSDSDLEINGHQARNVRRNSASSNASNKGWFSSCTVL